MVWSRGFAGCLRRMQFVAGLSVGVVIATGAMVTPVASEPAAGIPNLVGTWDGENHTISDKKGLKTWKKTIQITKQTDRRFRGHFDYSAGRKEFFGVIYPDNTSISWVASDSRGYNHGRILPNGNIAACYVESGIDATAGCVELSKQP